MDSFSDLRDQINFGKPLKNEFRQTFFGVEKVGTPNICQLWAKFYEYCLFKEENNVICKYQCM